MELADRNFGIADSADRISRSSVLSVSPHPVQEQQKAQSPEKGIALKVSSTQ